MAAYTRDEAARRAAVTPEYVDQLIELGIVPRSEDRRITAGGVRRILMAQTLETAGIALGELAEGIQRGRLSLEIMDSPMFERFAIMSDETFAQVSERTGVPLNLVMLIREATGGAAPEPGDRIREDEQVVVGYIRSQLETGFSPTSVSRMLRVMGDGMRRLAETEAHGWRSDIQEPMLARGATVTEIASVSMGESVQRLDEATDAGLRAIWHAQQARGWTSNIIIGFEQQLEAIGLLRKPTHPPAMCFLDITGYTRITQERGDEAAAGLAERLGRLVNHSSVEHGGRAIKWLGDGVMLYFPDPGPGVVAALDMVDGVADAGLPPAHVGLHAGPVLFQEGDYFGQTVNLAARIAEYARPGEVLVSRDVAQASAGAAARFTEIGEVDLKGVPLPVELLAAHRSG